MPRKAFLKKKSLLDRFKDDYATHTGYIQSARAEHTWNNPLTRRKRTKELNRWIKSFAGKDHIRKLARFNTTNAGRYESMYNEAMSLKGFLENLTEKLTKQFNLDAEKVQAYLDSHTQEMQELLDDKDLSLKEKVLFVRSEITGEQDDKKSERLVVSNPCVVYKGDAENAAKAHDYLYKKMPRVKGASISSDVKPLGNNKFCRVLFYGNNTGVMDLFGYYSNLYNDDFWNNCDADPQGWVDPLTINKYDVATPRQESKKSEFYMDGDDSEDYYYCHRCGRVTPSYELDAHGGFCSDCDARWMAEHENESKNTDEKLGYEKGHKNSRGEDAPWVIRSHEDNRILASFANKKDAEEHMKRMKQYSKTEKMDEAANDIAAIQDRCDPKIIQKIIYAFTTGTTYGWPYHPISDGGGRPKTIRLKLCSGGPSDYRFSNEGILFSNKEMDAAVEQINSSEYCIVRSSYNASYPAYFTTKRGESLRNNERIVTSIPHYEVPSSESKQNEGFSNEKVKDAVKFAAMKAGLKNYLNVDSDGAMSVTVSLPINSDDLKTVRWVIDSNDGTITEYLDTEKNLVRDFTDDESLVSMLTLLFQTSRMELRDWLPKKSESVNMDGFKNMLRTYNAKGGSVKNGPWCICDGANDLWFELYYNEKPILGCTDNICKWYSNPETVGMTLDDYKNIEDAISSEIFAIDSFKMPESKKSEDADDVTYELTEDAVTDLIKELGLEIVNTWYDGNKDRIVYDCKDMGDENGEIVCVWVEPPYEARVWLKDANPRVNQLVEGIEKIDALKAALVDIFKIELGESHVTESLRKPEDTIIVPNWLWETYTLGENYDGDTLTDDEQQTYLDFKEKYEGFNLKAVSEKTTFRSDNDFDSNGCPCYEVNIFKN